MRRLFVFIVFLSCNILLPAQNGGMEVDSRPVFMASGPKALYEFLDEELVYPPLAFKYSIEGVVRVAFTVTEKGEVKDIRIVRPLDKRLDEEAVRLVGLLNHRWIPAKKEGVPVEDRLTIDVHFRLKEREQKERNKLVRSNMPDAYVRGMEDLRMSHYREAIQHFNNLLRNNPDDYVVYLQRAKAWRAIGDTVRARKDIETYKVVKNRVISQILPDEAIDSLTNLNEYYRNFLDFDLAVLLHYDSLWRITTPEKALYRREAVWNDLVTDFNGVIRDYDRDFNLLQKGHYTLGKKDGVFLYYYPEGTLRRELAFRKDVPAGTWKFYDEQGELYRKIRMHGEDDFSVIYNRYSQEEFGVHKGVGNWLKLFIKRDKSGVLFVTGRFEDGKMDGTWEIRQNGQLIIEERYNKGKHKRTYLYPTGEKRVKTERVIGSWLLEPFELSQTDKLILENKEVLEYYPFLREQQIPTLVIVDERIKGLRD